MNHDPPPQPLAEPAKRGLWRGWDGERAVWPQTMIVLATH